MTYSPKFVKQVQKSAKRTTALGSSSSSTTPLPGEAMAGDDPLMSHLLKLAERKGWHSLSGLGINVSKWAKSFRTPEPRFSADAMPFRTSLACFEVNGQLFWRALERGVRFTALANQHALFQPAAHALVSVFSPEHLADLPDASLKQQET